jgi:tetratricopeptide (TPR) repeat protein
MAQPLLTPVSDLAPAPDPVARLQRALTIIKAESLRPLLTEAVALLEADEHHQACDLALKVLELDERCAAAWQIVAICRDRSRDFNGALACYEAALKIDPENSDYANNIGRLAHQMGQPEMAEALFRLALSQKPDFIDGYNNLSCSLRDQKRYDEAIEVIRQGLALAPQSGLLWNALGTIVAERGEMELAMVFYEEALKVEPDLAKARYNLSHSKQSLGDLDGALADCEAALGPTRVEGEVAMMRFARATILLSQGRVLEGWKAYAARLDPLFADSCLFAVEGRRWEPGQPLASQRLMMLGEQGLGDEVLFANMVPDVLKALGPDGRLTLAVSPRLVSLFQRSFPSAQVLPHATTTVEHRAVRLAPAVDPTSFDLWTPMASLLEELRPDVAAFPAAQGFLTPDPDRVAYWRGVLARDLPGRPVGICWKSLKMTSARMRYYAGFDTWTPILRTPGVSAVNLQYSDASEEIAWARDNLGVDIWTPPNIDLRNDLDDLTALCRALELVIGPPNATTNLSAACGTETWLLCADAGWPQLGTGRFPWYPSSRVFRPQVFGDWRSAMREVAAALANSKPQGT